MLPCSNVIFQFALAVFNVRLTFDANSINHRIGIHTFVAVKMQQIVSVSVHVDRRVTLRVFPESITVTAPPKQTMTVRMLGS